MGWKLLGVECDGKCGIFKAFGTIPVYTTAIDAKSR